MIVDIIDIVLIFFCGMSMFLGINVIWMIVLVIAEAVDSWKVKHRQARKE